MKIVRMIVFSMPANYIGHKVQENFVFNEVNATVTGASLIHIKPNEVSVLLKQWDT